MDDSQFPYISKELVEYLEEIYPDVVPLPEDTEREVWMKTGNVHVVRWLRQVHDDQQEEITSDVEIKR